jgi:TPR repeat protein
MLANIQMMVLSKQADGGDLDAQIKVAELYLATPGTKNAFSNAFKYFSMAARKDHPKALFFLAECQERGKGLPASPELAFMNYLKAAKKGHLEACVSVGHFYETGRAVFKDLPKAKEFYAYAASKGNAEAKKSLLRVLNDKGGPVSTSSPLDKIKMMQAAQKK